jgi:hypothetical protein
VPHAVVCLLPPLNHKVSPPLRQSLDRTSSGRSHTDCNAARHPRHHSWSHITMSTPAEATNPRSATTSPRSPRSPQNAPGTTVAQVIQPENEPVEADDDQDSTYGSEASSSYSASVTSSIRNNIHENGLRYHAFKQDAYCPFPNDENEQNRDDIKHAMTVMLCGGKLHYAPIGDHPQSILDLGTWHPRLGDAS